MDTTNRTFTSTSLAAVIFDMDGVVTRTAAVHARAWREMFDTFLAAQADRHAGARHPFDHPREYLAYIDGRPRYEGVATFLHARQLHLPFGRPEDPPGMDTVCALGNRKNALFNEIVAREGVGVYASSVSLIRELRAHGIRVGLATSSRNSALVLERSRTADLFETVVDGLAAARLGLAGKPAPDIFLTAAERLGVTPEQTVVVEDAASGVEAGKAGGFALTVGLAREDNAAELRAHGADVVFADLAETNLEELETLILRRRDSASAGTPANPISRS